MRSILKILSISSFKIAFLSGVSRLVSELSFVDYFIKKLRARAEHPGYLEENRAPVRSILKIGSLAEHPENFVDLSLKIALPCGAF